MIGLPGNVRVYLACGVTDMRKGFDGLAARVQTTLQLDPHGGALFVFRGRRGQHTSARQLHRIVRLAAGRAGITKRVGVHTLRHCFATHLLEQKTDIRVIQVLLGHKKLDTTALYTRVAIHTIGQVTSPLDFLRKMPG